jgi:hypothetical protein
MSIDSLRKSIHNELSTTISVNFSDLKNSDIKRLFDLYDDYFFGGSIMEKINSSGSTIKFTSSSLGGSTFAGKCIMTKAGMKCTFELRFPSKLFLKLFTQKGSNKLLKTNGIICRDRLECLQLVFEHELVHLIMHLWNYYDKSGDLYSSHGKLFQCMTKSLFDHTDYRHELFNEFEEGTEFITKKVAFVGMDVYILVDGKNIYGKITKVNPKKAIIQTESGKMYKSSYVLIRKADKKVSITEFIPDKKKELSVGDDVYVLYNEVKYYGQIIKKNPHTLKIRLEKDKSIVIAGYSLIYKSDRKVNLSPLIKKGKKSI